MKGKGIMAHAHLNMTETGAFMNNGEAWAVIFIFYVPANDPYVTDEEEE